MAKEYVDMLFGPNGEVIVEAVGIKGPGCKQRTKFLEDALGKEIDIRHKIEWHLQNAKAIQREKARGMNPSNMCG